MPDFPKLDIVAVGAHPDDVECACGGTLARLVELGYSVGIVDLTDGEPTPRCPSPEVRIAEARAAAAELGVTVRTILDLPNRRLFDSFEARVALASELRKHRPRLVLGFGDKTPTASPDHWQAMQITDAAVFYSRLTKWDDHFGDLPVHTIEAQLYFQNPFQPAVTAAGANSFVMDISSTLERKLSSVRCYETQFSDGKAHLVDRLRYAALNAGTAAGFDAGEWFHTPRPLGTTDLMNAFFIERPSRAAFHH